MKTIFQIVTAIAAAVPFVFSSSLAIPAQQQTQPQPASD